MRIREHHWIFIGMLAGVGLGLVAPAGGNIIWLCKLFGETVFIGALKMLVAPLIFFSILAGITSLPNESELWDIGWRTFAYYMLTTFAAVTTGIVVVNLFQPGVGLGLVVEGEAALRPTVDREHLAASGRRAH